MKSRNKGMGDRKPGARALATRVGAIRALSLAALLGLVLSGIACRDQREPSIPQPGVHPTRPGSPPQDTAPSEPPPVSPPTDTRPQVPADVPTHLGAPTDGVRPPSESEDSQQGGEADVEAAIPDEFRPQNSAQPQDETEEGSDPRAWNLPLSASQLQALDSYSGFSSDSLLYAFVEQGDGVAVLNFVSVPTHTIEKSLPLIGSSGKTEAAEALIEEGFLPPEGQPAIPDALSAAAEGSTVQLLFAGMPAGRAFQPFAGHPGLTPGQIQIEAVSPDAKVVAIRVDSRESPQLTEHHLVRLFE